MLRYCRLNYCNPFFTGLPKKYIKKPELIQNTLPLHLPVKAVSMTINLCCCIYLFSQCLFGPGSLLSFLLLLPLNLFLQFRTTNLFYFLSFSSTFLTACIYFSFLFCFCVNFCFLHLFLLPFFIYSCFKCSKCKAL